jgi:hypothetical protein
MKFCTLLPIERIAQFSFWNFTQCCFLIFDAKEIFYNNKRLGMESFSKRLKKKNNGNRREKEGKRVKNKG